MITVTNLIVLLAPSDWSEAATEGDSHVISHLNSVLCDLGQPSLKRVDEFWNGSKAMEVEVYIGAFNCVDVTKLAEAIVNAPWSDEDSQVLVKLQDDNFFTLLRPQGEFSTESEGGAAYYNLREPVKTLYPLAVVEE